MHDDADIDVERLVASLDHLRDLAQLDSGLPTPRLPRIPDAGDGQGAVGGRRVKRVSVGTATADPGARPKHVSAGEEIIIEVPHGAVATTQDEMACGTLRSGAPAHWAVVCSGPRPRTGVGKNRVAYRANRVAMRPADFVETILSVVRLGRRTVALQGRGDARPARRPPRGSTAAGTAPRPAVDRAHAHSVGVGRHVRHGLVASAPGMWRGDMRVQ